MPNSADNKNGVPDDSPGLRHDGTSPIRHSPAFGIVAELVPSCVTSAVANWSKSSFFLGTHQS
jgi:hypothetical protein